MHISSPTLNHIISLIGPTVSDHVDESPMDRGSPVLVKDNTAVSLIVIIGNPEIFTTRMTVSEMIMEKWDSQRKFANKSGINLSAVRPHR